MKTNKNESYNKGLRERAEEFISKNPSAIKKLPSGDVKKLIEDLQIHQVELEMQNEELRRAQLELEAARDKYSDLYDFAPVGYFTISDKGMILEANLTGATVLGVERGLLIGNPFSKFINRDDQDIFYHHRRKLIETKNKQTCELRFVKKDGSQFHAQMGCIPVLDENGNLDRVRAAVTDITERKRLEEQLLHAQKMEAMGTLAGGIAHNFNNLLMGIQSNASLMLLEKTPDHPYYERLRNIEQGVKRGAELTRQLLGFAMGGKYEVKPTDINGLIKRSSDMFGRTKREIAIHTKYQEGIWPVEVDQGQIEQVFVNLYVNASHAMPGGGELYVETENVTLDDNYVKPYDLEPGRYVKISVTDTGAGMDKKTQQRIFEPFFTTKEMGRGTGLGLASVYGIIKNHGGIITVHSVKGEETTFTVYLPASEKEVTKEVELPEEVVRGTETFLLVDDEDMVLDVGEEILKELGYKVLVARSGKEAIEIYKAHNDVIAIVVLDMIMPVMGGGETYDRMKEINPNIKVLLSSGYSIDGKAQEIMDRGCNGFIQKPFNIKELSQEVRKILDQK